MSACRMEPSAQQVNVLNGEISLLQSKIFELQNRLDSMQDSKLRAELKDRVSGFQTERAELIAQRKELQIRLPQAGMPSED